MKRFLYFFTLILLFSTFLISNKAVAQEAGNVPVDQITNVEVVPQTPGANEDVSITVESFSYDLSRAKINWYLNNSLKSSGVGKTNFNFTTGAVGSISTIKYQITTGEGVYFEKSITISPGDVTLIWESAGYTPPFYKGKSMFSYEGSLRIIAIPNLVNANGVKYKPEELVYTWKRGMGTDTGASGYGKNVFLWNGSLVGNTDKIEVEVSNINKSTKATASLSIKPIDTEIVAYENDPALGILFNKAIKNSFDLLGSEISFVAMPFYFNNPEKNATYSWFVNGNKSPETSKYITFRNTSGDNGYSKISFDLTSQTKILQSANSGFDIYMGKQNNSSPVNIFKSFFGDVNF